MKINYIAFSIVFLLMSCEEKSTLKLSFLDEFILKDSLSFKDTTIGGLSGIDYTNGNYYMVVDDSKEPRVLKAKILIEDDTISKVDFLEVIHINDAVPFLENTFLDLESIFIDEHNHMNLVSEGSIRKGKSPSVFSVNTQGKFIGVYALPEYFKANSYAKPRHNATFEASCKSFDKEGFWLGMEGVLEADGNEVSLKKENPPARITHFDTRSNKITKQFAYPLDYLKRPYKGTLNINGITAILEYAKNNFLVVERSFQKGYGTEGNLVKIYKVILDETITNTTNIKSLKKESYIPVKKELVFDFNNIRNQLTSGVVDNIEGITLGPKLANGNQSLLLITDDNFQKHGKQLNQFILLEMKK